MVNWNVKQQQQHRVEGVQRGGHRLHKAGKPQACSMEHRAMGPCNMLLLLLLLLLHPMPAPPTPTPPVSNTHTLRGRGEASTASQSSGCTLCMTWSIRKERSSTGLTGPSPLGRDHRRRRSINSGQAMWSW